MGAFDAKRWAAALLAAAGGDSEAAVVAFERFAAVFAESARGLRVPGGKIEERRLGEAYAGMLERASVGQAAAVRMLQLMARRRRLASLGEVAAAARDGLDEKNGIVHALVETAVPMDEELRSRVRNALVRRTGARRVELTERTMPELLGGIRLSTGSERIDGSIRKRLEQMASSMGVVSQGGPNG